MMMGARARSGPPPDPDSLTQADGEWTVLPAAGRGGKLPSWPLDDPSMRELGLWEGEWTRPQAIMWESQGQELEVALFVRSLVAAEKSDAATNMRTLVRQQMEALGISMPGLLRNRWRIGVDPGAVAAGAVMRRSSRDRLKVVGGDP